MRPFAERGARTLVHAVFDGRAPHGDVFARIAPCVPGGGPCVPHIVQRREICGPDLRHELGIPEKATVFGRHGGRDVFDVAEARQAVIKVARSNPEIYFLFMNTDPIGGDPALTESMANIIHLPPTLDEVRYTRHTLRMLHVTSVARRIRYTLRCTRDTRCTRHAQARKAAFIRSCDAMIHARRSRDLRSQQLCTCFVTERVTPTALHACFARLPAVDHLNYPGLSHSRYPSRQLQLREETNGRLPGCYLAVTRR